MDDLYQSERKVGRCLVRLEQSDLAPKNKEFIRKFVDDCYSIGLSHGRVLKYLSHLIVVAKATLKNFDEMDTEDVKAIVRRIELNPRYRENTKRDYRIVIKRFYRWLGGGKVPECAEWIKTGAKQSRKLLPEELLTENDIRDLIKAADNPRDKAFIFVLYESGCRIGELMSIKLKNVVFDRYGAQLIVNGKTGSRRVRIIAGCDYLRYWFENHPGRSYPESYLWVNLSNRHRGRLLRYEVAHKRLRDIAKRAGVRKKVNFHNFRHARATHLASKLTESQLCEIFGWTLGSRMPATYVHLSGRNVDDALLKMYGLKETSEDESITCPRCKSRNDEIARYCIKCGLPFGLDVVLESEKGRTADDELMSALVEDREVQDVLRKVLRKLRTRTDGKSIRQENGSVNSDLANEGGNI